MDMMGMGAAASTVHSILILGILLGCSLVCLMLVLERLIFFKGMSGADPEKVLLKLQKSLLAGRIDEALSIVGKPDGNPILSVIEVGVKNSQLPKEQAAELMRACQLRQRAAMERNLGVLGTLGNTAPFIGLLGTVLGIIQAFKDLAGPQAAANGASVVAVGIAEALVATAAGLIVAIPAVCFYNYFLKKVKGVMTEMDVVITEMSVILSLKGEKHAG